MDELQVNITDKSFEYYSFSNLTDFIDPNEITRDMELQVIGYVTEHKIGGNNNQLVEQNIKELCIIPYPFVKTNF